MRRISEKVFNETKTLEELLAKMKVKQDFKYRLRQYKDFIKEELPEFTIEEILKIDEHYSQIKKIYNWSFSAECLAALTFEQMQKEQTNEN